MCKVVCNKSDYSFLQVCLVELKHQRALSLFSISKTYICGHIYVVSAWTNLQGHFVLYPIMRILSCKGQKLWKFKHFFSEQKLEFTHCNDIFDVLCEPSCIYLMITLSIRIILNPESSLNLLRQTAWTLRLKKYNKSNSCEGKTNNNA